MVPPIFPIGVNHSLAVLLLWLLFEIITRTNAMAITIDPRVLCTVVYCPTQSLRQCINDLLHSLRHSKLKENHIAYPHQHQELEKKR